MLWTSLAGFIPLGTGWTLEHVLTDFGAQGCSLVGSEIRAHMPVGSCHECVKMSWSLDNT